MNTWRSGGISDLGLERQFISFPKSGRSWLRFALLQLKVANDIRFHHDGFEYSNYQKPPLDYDFDQRLKRYANVDKIVYLYRDPRDVMVSLYHQVTERLSDIFTFTGNISEFLRDPYFGAANLQIFRSQWSSICERGGTLAISYESCHCDFRIVLKSVMDYYEFEVEEETLDYVANLSKFENMQKIERNKELAPTERWLRPRNGFPKIRRGQVGGFVNELNATDIEYLNLIFFSKPLFLDQRMF